MAPVLSRSLATASLASLPSFNFTVRKPNKVLNLASSFMPQNGFRNGLACSGLKWKLERRNRGFTFRCEAVVTEKETADTPGEKFEYQAEVCRFRLSIIWGLFFSRGY